MVTIGLVGLLYSGRFPVMGTHEDPREADVSEVRFTVAWDDCGQQRHENSRGNSESPASFYLSSENETEETQEREETSGLKIESSSKEVSVSEEVSGGRVSSPEESTELFIERSAFPEGADFEITKKEARWGFGEMRGAGFYVDVEVSEQPREPVEMRLHYSEEDLYKTVEESLRIYYYNPETAVWEGLPEGGVDTEKNFVWAMVPHFSRYGILGQPEKDNSTVTTSVTVLNVAPTAGAVTINPDEDDPGIKVNKTGSNRTVTAWLTATDNNLASDITSGTCDWVGPTTGYMGESASLNTLSDTERNVTCTHVFTGDDESGSWTVNVTATDDDSASANSTESFEYG